MMIETKHLIVGGGLTGLAAARRLWDGGLKPTLLEANPAVGGLTRTTRVDRYCFDYTGHLLHLARFGAPSGVPYANLRDEDWERIDRQSLCYLGGKLVTAPVQYHLAELPGDLFRQCVESYEDRPPRREDGAETFRDYVVSGFGQALADVFLIPQNEKTQSTDLGRLSSAAVKRFFPAPSEDLVRAGIRGEALPGGATYNSKFWYPRLGGIQSLVDGLANGLPQVERLCEVIAIDIKEHTAKTSDGRMWRWERLLSSIPLRDLCLCVNDPELNEWGSQLTASATVAFNIGCQAPVVKDLRDAHWIYTPDRALPYYRVGIYSNLSGGLCPRGDSAYYVEVGVPSDSVDQVDVFGRLWPRVLDSLEAAGWIDRQSIDCLVAHVMRCAYAHHTPEREAVMNQIIKRLAACGIHTMGRYGLWDYTSMEDSIQSGLETAEQIL